MKLSNGDFQSQLDALKGLQGSRLQVVRTFETGLELGFYTDGEVVAWYFDLSPGAPAFLAVPSGSAPPLKPKKKPMELFLKAHVLGKRLMDVLWNPEYGRVFQLQFSGDTKLEFRLFPRGANAIVTTPDKRLAWSKPSELVIIPWKSEPALHEGRSTEELWRMRFSTEKKSSAKAQNRQEQELSKLKKVLEKLKASSSINEAEKWKALGFALQSDGARELPFPGKSLSENIDLCFKKAKAENEKTSARAQRLSEIEKQIAALERGESKTSNQRPESLLFKSSSRGSTKTLSSGNQIFFGKSAEDNLKLLRAASPSDLWFHLKDFPGSHGILKKQKGEKILPNILLEAATALVEFQLRNKAAQFKGEKFDVIVAELRYVKPIKGDKLGRVTYSNTTTLRVKFD